MRVLFCIALLLATCAHAFEEDQLYAISIPTQCEDVLSVKVCTKYRNVSSKLKLGVNTVTEAVQNAHAKGKRTAEEIQKAVEDFYLEKLKGKTCKDFIAQQVCEKLQLAGKHIQIAAGKTGELVVKAMLAGKEKTAEIYKQVLEYYHAEIYGKSCEELIKSTKACDSLRRASVALKVPFVNFARIVRETAMKGYNATSQRMDNAIQSMKDFAKENLRCEALLNPKLCVVLREYAEKTKVGLPKVMSTVYDLLATGVKVSTGFVKFVYKITDAFIDCEHFFTHESCKLLKEKITAAGGTVSDIGHAVRDIAEKTITGAKDIYEKVVSYTKSKLCRHLGLACPSVAYKRSLAASKFKTLLDKYKQMLKNGVVNAKEMLRKSIEETLDSLKVVDEKIRQLVKNAITHAKGNYSDLKKLITNILQKSNLGRQRRSLAGDLVEKLSKSAQELKASISDLLQRSTDALKGLAKYVASVLQQIMKKNNVGYEGFDDVDALSKMADEMVTEELERQSKDIDSIVSNAVEESLGSLLNDLQADNAYSLASNLGDLYQKMYAKISTLLQSLQGFDLESLQSAMKDAGMRIIKHLEDLLSL